MTSVKLNLLASAAIAAFTITPSALAQQAPAEPSAPETSTPSGGLEEIIVTARRTDENLQRVPVAATVLTGEVLARQGISSARDLQFNAPSLVITPDPLGGSSTPIFQLRGQTAPVGTDNTVVTYFADVPVDARVIAAGIFDLASVQVIRGPQGTLFGKNSTGGAVVFTPRKATADSVSGYGEVTVGNYDLRQFTGAVNLPIVQDVLALRVSGQITRQDGFVKNLLGPDGNDKHYEAARAMLAFTPEGNFENDLLVTYFNGRQRLNPYIATAIGGFSNFFPAAIAGFARQQLIGPRKIAMSEALAPNNDDNESYLISNVSSYDFGSVTLKNIVGYSNTHLNIQMNQPAYEFSQVNVSQNRHLDQISDEVQLSGTSLDDSLKWIVGGFYSKQKQTVIQRARLFSPNPNSFSDSMDEYTSKAVFGQATYDFTNIGLAGLKLTGGIRHTWDKRVGSNLQNVPIPVQFKDQRVSWTIGLDYQVTDNVLLYAASRRSYKAGGFNLISPTTPRAILQYAPEVLTDIEVGIKAKFEVGTVPFRTNLALYKGKYENIQTQVTGVCGGSTGQSSFIINAGKGTPKGLEFEVETRLTDNLVVSGFYNRTLGKYDRFIIPTVSGCTLSAAANNLAGQDFGNIAKDTAGLNAVYTLPLARDEEELQLSGNLYVRGNRAGNDLKGFNVAMKGYTLLNARLDYNHVAGSPVSVGVFVRNLTDKLYALTRNSVLNVAGYDVSQYGDPRTYGVVAKVEFRPQHSEPSMHRRGQEIGPCGIFSRSGDR